MTTVETDTAIAPALPLRIEPVTAALMQPMLDFGALHYPPGNPNLDRSYLEWLCLQNPSGAAQALIIEDQGRLVGLALLVPLGLLVNGRAQMSYFVVNVLTHPDYRKMRFFSRIIDTAREFCVRRGEWLMGHPNAAALPGWKRKEMAFQPPLVGMIGGLGFGLTRRATTLGSEGDLIREWPEVIASLPSVPDEVCLDRTVEYMAWRFLQRPDRRYRIAISRDRKGGLAGFFVSRRFKPGVDLLVDHGVSADGGGSISLNRPCLVMAPLDRMPRLATETGAVRLPVRKEMPFFASTFDDKSLDFSRVTLAASDF